MAMPADVRLKYIGPTRRLKNGGHVSSTDWTNHGEFEFIAEDRSE